MTFPGSVVASGPRHPRFVRMTHWLMTIAFLALLVTGVEVVLSHPRFYWGEVGNVNTAPLFALHVPSSRGSVATGYDYTLPDQNGWSRYLHFESAWLVLIVGLVYLVAGVRSGHFRRSLLPSPEDRTWRAIGSTIAGHLRFTRAAFGDAWSYNALQRMSYLLVVFVLFPLIIWTGLAMSPGFTSVFPWAVTLLGGRQSARTLHFFITIALVAFTLIHVLMVVLTGFRARMRAMITGVVEASS